MSFSYSGGASSYEKSEENTKKYKQYTKTAISSSYYMLCLKKCINDYSSPLEKGEKICLAKCVDRAYDYFSINEDHLNPYSKQESL